MGKGEEYTPRKTVDQGQEGKFILAKRSLLGICYSLTELES